MNHRVDESAVALAVAESLSSVIRGVDPTAALQLLRARVDDDPDVLAAAQRHCLGQSHVSYDVVCHAADLLATAATQARDTNSEPGARPSAGGTHRRRVANPDATVANLDRPVRGRMDADHGG